MSEDKPDQSFGGFPAYLKFCVTPASDPSKEQVLKALFMMRQITAIIFGIVCGLNNMVGLPIIIAFLLFTMGFSYFYTFKFLAIDEEKVENTEVYMEGFPPSLALFILFWTISHTIVQ